MTCGAGDEETCDIDCLEMNMRLVRTYVQVEGISIRKHTSRELFREIDTRCVLA